MASPLRRCVHGQLPRPWEGRLRLRPAGDQGAVHRRPVRPPGGAGGLGPVADHRPAFGAHARRGRAPAPAQAVSAAVPGLAGGDLPLGGPGPPRQGKRVLAPFQGSRVANFRSVVREVAQSEVDRWQPGSELVLRERMRTLTFDVICRAVFGVYEPERVERLRSALAAVIDSSPFYLIFAPLRWKLGRWSPGSRFARRLAAADALIYEEIERRRSVSDLETRTDVLSLLLQARDEDGNAMSDAEL